MNANRFARFPRSLLSRRAGHHPRRSASTTPETGTKTTDTATSPPANSSVPKGTLNPPEPSSSSSSSSSTFLRRNRTALLWSLVPLALGTVAGLNLVGFIAPPPLPAPGSREDGVLLADLHARIDRDFKVNVLRGKCLGASRQLRRGNGGPSAELGWVEILSAEEGGVGRVGDGSKVARAKQASAANGAAVGTEERENEGGALVRHLQGARGLGVERVFWDRAGRRLVAVLWLGPALSGWPGVTHGGALATALTEKMALAKALTARDEEGGTGEMLLAAPRLPGTGDHAKMLAPCGASVFAHPTALSLSYVKPTHANNFYVIRVSSTVFGEEEAAARVGEGKGLRQPFTSGQGYEATLETLDGRPCVKAQATFAPPPTTTVAAIRSAEERIVHDAKENYEAFRRWMWPSRQRDSQIA